MMLALLVALAWAADWWSLRPIAEVAPPETEAPGPTHPVDAFLSRALRDAGLTMSPPASPRVQVRRLHFDLIGLPPTPEVVAAFERDPSDEAYERLVDRLLDSPDHGERWARHWLDVARYGESHGFEYNEPRRNAWPYRDWVVRALNEDLPFDEFARLQVAGDVLDPGPDGAAAVGFLVAGVHNTVLPASEVLKRQARQDELEDIVGTVSEAFQGMTASCARCHDHKSDPIPTEDYYRMASALAGVHHGERDVETAEGKKRIFTALSRQPGPMRVHRRGSAADLGAEVEPGGLAALGLDADFGPSDLSEGQRRLRLAAWITSPENPLFARVAVNRVWHHHFGAGIVETPNDFGRTGGRPSHAELLDWLAGRFRESGYRPKELHRLLVTSDAYRQSSRSRAEAFEVDAENRLLWRRAPHRLEAEALRDSMLFVAGILDDRRGGPGYEDVRELHFNAGRYYLPIEDGVFDRRTIYRFSPRGQRGALLDGFDCPDPSATVPRRSVTTTPLQALSLLHNPFVLRVSRSFAERVEREAGSDPRAQVRQAWLLALGRGPTASEETDAIALVHAFDLATLCRALFNCSEFSLID